MDLKFDIETIPTGDSSEIEVRAPANYKKPEAIEKYISEHRDEEFRKGALKGISGEIVSIAWQINNNDIEAITRNKNMSEAELLSQFFGKISLEKDFGNFKWIGHNSIDFDLRFLKQRCWINRVSPPLIIPADAKHGTFSFDVMKEWAGWKGFVSQDALYKVLGGPPFDNDNIDGSMIYDLWLEKEYETIKNYNIRDVKKLSYNYEVLKS